jgi:hypothetical protein
MVAIVLVTAGATFWREWHSPGLGIETSSEKYDESTTYG